MMILVSLVYYMSILKGENVEHQKVEKYVAREREAGRSGRCHSTFAIGLSACQLEYFGEW